MSHASYESWLGLGGHALIDCRSHHEDSNRRAGRTVTRWHHPAPSVQTTWGPLIQLTLAFEARASEATDVAAYQRDLWGRTTGNTALLEISALHAQNMSVAVEGESYRPQRIRELKGQLEANQPRFALFYGVSYRSSYEAIAGPFNAEGWRWSRNTLCVLTQHPAYRYAPPAAFWRALGVWMRNAISAGASNPLSTPMPQPEARPIQRAPRSNVALPTAVSAHIPMTASTPELDAYDPTWSLLIIERLVTRHGFHQAHFALLHHFGPRSSLQQHIVYCRRLKGRFTAHTNATVALRLHRLLGYVDAGMDTAPALQQVIRDLPMPPR